MTPQFQILTETMCWPKDGKWNNINPFYKASHEEVEGRLEFAKKVYHDVFQFGFISAYCIREALQLGIIENGTLQELGAK